MNKLITYLECEFTTPANTLGAGNPCVDPDGNGLSEPIGVIKGCSGKPSTENTKFYYIWKLLSFSKLLSLSNKKGIITDGRISTNQRND